MKRYEIEQKFRVRSPRPVRTRLLKLGAVKLRAGRQDNHYYDFRGELKSRRMILRLRRTETTACLTLKGPRVRARYTKRPEFETPVDFCQAREILAGLGYAVFRRYRKHREEYRYRGCVVTLDRIPGGRWFLEIEGAEKRIGRIADALELKPSDREERSYLAILFPRDRIDDRVR